MKALKTSNPWFHLPCISAKDSIIEQPMLMLCLRPKSLLTIVDVIVTRFAIYAMECSVRLFPVDSISMALKYSML